MTQHSWRMYSGDVHPYSSTHVACTMKFMTVTWRYYFYVMCGTQTRNLVLRVDILWEVNFFNTAFIVNLLCKTQKPELIVHGLWEAHTCNLAFMAHVLWWDHCCIQVLTVHVLLHADTNNPSTHGVYTVGGTCIKYSTHCDCTQNNKPNLMVYVLWEAHSYISIHDA